jgi:phosphatidylglycerophosphate synthase
MVEIFFDIIFPLILVALLVIIFLSGLSHRTKKRDFMTCDEFIKDWLKDHGQQHKLDQQFIQMKKDPSGKLYMPLTYRGAKFFIKLGLSPNKVSIINLILSFFIFYAVIIAGRGQTLDLYTEQPLYGFWFFFIALLVLFTGIVDGIDGAIARLLDIKSKSGGWFDNVIDRVSDTLILVCFVPTSFLILSGLDLRWLVWTNILIIFIYEYMRARHEGLGLLETKPTIGERIVRILIIATFYVIYGISSLTVLLTSLISSTSVSIWAVSHEWIVTWAMLIFQVSLLAIMIFATFQSGSYIWKNLKKMDVSA